MQMLNNNLKKWIKMKKINVCTNINFTTERKKKQE